MVSSLTVDVRVADVWLLSTVLWAAPVGREPAGDGPVRHDVSASCRAIRPERNRQIYFAKRWVSVIDVCVALMDDVTALVYESAAFVYMYAGHHSARIWLQLSLVHYTLLHIRFKCTYFTSTCDDTSIVLVSIATICCNVTFVTVYIDASFMNVYHLAFAASSVIIDAKDHEK